MNKTPSIDEIDLSSIPDQEMGKFVLANRLEEIDELSDDERITMYTTIQICRKDFVTHLQANILTCLNCRTNQGIGDTLTDVEGTANAVTDLIYKILGDNFNS